MFAMLVPRHVRFFIYLFLLSLTVVLQGQLHAQSEHTGQELKRLQRQIDDLREVQKAIQKELQEIKASLPPRVGASVPPPNVSLRVDHSRSKGDKNARLTLIEFSDYQCPFCERHFRETLPQIEKEYISTGKLKYVLRDFPLENIHKDALKAAEAASCAGEQGKYWQMHDRLFQNQSRLGVAELPKHAQAIGLDISGFQECLQDGRHAKEIRQDLEEGQKAGVRGTPTFFLGIQDGNDQSVKVVRIIHGAQPYAHFKEAIEGAWKELKK